MRCVDVSDLMFLVAVAEKGLIFMDYYNESGRVKARQRLDRIKQETSKQGAGDE
jgi:hypothetical protein